MKIKKLEKKLGFTKAMVDEVAQNIIKASNEIDEFIKNHGK